MATATLEAPKTIQAATPTLSKGSPRRRKLTSEHPSVPDASGTNASLSARACAAQYLSRRGYEILERDWRCNAGRVDIIASDDGILVFATVQEGDSATGFLGITADRSMRDSFERTALDYLSKRDTEDMTIRFDVIGVVPVDRERAIVRHHINALSVA